MGQQILADDRLDALFFTGSAKTGIFLNQFFAKNPGKMIALEMGGNNPLVIGQGQRSRCSSLRNPSSAYLSSGQRCTCARRLIVINNDPFIEKLIQAIPKLKVGSYEETPEPFIGPLIHEQAALDVIASQEKLMGKAPCSQPTC